MDTDEFIADTMRRVGASVVAPPLAPPVAPRRARRWSTPLMIAAAVCAIAFTLAGIGVVVSEHRGDQAAGPAPTGQTAAGGCRVDYVPTSLPAWARTGFSPPTQPMAHVLGDEGDIVAVLWATHDPLVAPPDDRRGNKILWVARVGAGDGPLQITATLAGTGQTVTRTVESAPGPSAIDLPAAGCWSFDLTWGEHHDHLMLGYAPGPG